MIVEISFVIVRTLLFEEGLEVSEFFLFKVIVLDLPMEVDPGALFLPKINFLLFP